MSRETYLEKIQERIIKSGRGSVFIISDFSDISSTQTTKKILSRLSENQTIRRIMRGVYEYPEYNDFLGEYVTPSVDKIACALARNFGWNIVPGGDVALNMLVLSTQVPAVWLYASDGPSKEYSYGNVTIKFRHTTKKDISGMSDKTALIIQALKAIGRTNIHEKHLQILSGRLSSKEKSEIIAESKHTTVWVNEALKQICS